MDSEYEVYTRRICNVYTCRAGEIMPYKTACAVCEGKGYIEEWKDLETLIKQIIRIGG